MSEFNDCTAGPPNPSDDAKRLAMMATDAQNLMVQADTACKGHAAIRNAALVRLREVYGLDVPTIARLTGINDRTVRNAVFRTQAKAKKL